MSAPSYTPELQASYQRLFDTCVIAPDKYPFVDAAVKLITDSRARYETVSKATNVPWYFVGIVHNMEGGSKFTAHLHNGDPLTARTVHVPAGRPAAGNPPFTWEFSAEDALAFTNMTHWTDWSLPGILYKLEGYNGYGYRSKNINTPYLWSFTNQYTSGKYVQDGKYDAAAVSKQCGAAAILRRLVEKQIVVFGHTDRVALIKQVGATVVYAPTTYDAKAEELQNLLNLNGAHLKADGKAGQITSDAYKVVTGLYLSGDSRKV
jgi:lysozyme family protein